MVSDPLISKKTVIGTLVWLSRGSGLLTTIGVVKETIKTYYELGETRYHEVTTERYINNGVEIPDNRKIIFVEDEGS